MSKSGFWKNGDNSVIQPYYHSPPMMIMEIPELVDIERGFLLLFAFLCILAFIIPFYCYRPYNRQRAPDIEDQDDYVQRATELPYTDDSTSFPR